MKSGPLKSKLPYPKSVEDDKYAVVLTQRVKEAESKLRDAKAELNRIRSNFADQLYAMSEPIL